MADQDKADPLVAQIIDQAVRISSLADLLWVCIGNEDTEPGKFLDGGQALRMQHAYELLAEYSMKQASDIGRLER